MRTSTSSIPETFLRLASAESTGVSAAARTISFVFATSNVARDGHRILPGAWKGNGHDGLADFRKNPVFLWSHNAEEPPIGKVTQVSEQNGALTGAVQFAQHDFADTVFQLFKDGFLRGASVSWQPIDWNYATSPGRAPGAIDFSKVNLLEISAVTLPADTDALAKAGERGLISPQFARKLAPSSGNRMIAPRIHQLNGRIYNLRIPKDVDAYCEEMEAIERRRRWARARALEGARRWGTPLPKEVVEWCERMEAADRRREARALATKEGRLIDFEQACGARRPARK